MNSAASGSLMSIIKSIGISDIFDILIIAIIIYGGLDLIIRTKSFQLVRGVFSLVIFYGVAKFRGLRAISFVIEKFAQIGLLAVLVLFQPEIRRALEQLGNTDFFKRFSIRKTGTGHVETDEIRKAIVGICDGVERMSEKQTGALIVMENFSSIEGIKATGTAVNADITPELLGTIFYEGSPLHDGAVIVSDNRISHAGCVLPLSENYDISKDLGTRHRAALGLSEHSDAICIVVSEETGIISVAMNRELKRSLNRESLYDLLTGIFVTPLLETQMTQKKSFLRRNTNE